MSTATEFIAELIRAANEIEAVNPFERRRLVECAAATIAAQRQLLVLRDRVVPLSHGVVSDLDAMMRHAPAGPDLVIGAVLLQCAEEIRRLQILAKESATPSE